LWPKKVAKRIGTTRSAVEKLRRCKIRENIKKKTGKKKKTTKNVVGSTISGKIIEKTVTRQLAI
jgi:hypothetical protein